MAARSFKSIDGITRHAPALLHQRPMDRTAPIPPMPKPRPQAPPPQAAAPLPAPHVERKYAAAPPPPRRRRRFWRHMQLPVFVLGGMVAGVFMQSLMLGIGIAAMYALVAWFGRVPSRITFVLAFLSLLTVVALLVVRQNVELAGNFATYTFLLLVTGIVSLMLESRVSPKLKRGKIRGKI